MQLQQPLFDSFLHVFETLYNLMTATNNVDEIDVTRPNKPDTIVIEPGTDHNMARRIMDYARLGMKKRNGTKKTRNPGKHHTFLWLC